MLIFLVFGNFRSPPVTPSNLGGPVFPTGSHFGTLRGTQNLFQSQESIHVNGRPSGESLKIFFGSLLQTKIYESNMFE